MSFQICLVLALAKHFKSIKSSSIETNLKGIIYRFDISLSWMDVQAMDLVAEIGSSIAAT